MFARRRLYLPADLCQSENLDTDEVFAGRSSQALQAVTAHVAVRAQVQPLTILLPLFEAARHNALHHYSRNESPLS